MTEAKWTLRSPAGSKPPQGTRDCQGWLDLLLDQRDIQGDAHRQAFIEADWQSLSSPYALLNMQAAVNRLQKAIAQNETICIYGDYDVDGMSSIALLRQTFAALGCKVAYYVPNRLEEGYGMNLEALQSLQDQGTDLVLTVDNGVAAKDLIAAFPDMTFIVTDHHEVTQGLPDAIMINPQLDQDPTAPFRHLCGAGVAFFLARALLEAAFGKHAQPLILEILPYAAVATVADVVPLIGDNRILVKKGLDVIQAQPKPFIKALWPAILEGKQLESSHIGFQIGPRLNACGRLGQPRLGVSLLESQDDQEAVALAQEANDLNEERKRLERAIYREAKNQIAPGAPALLAWGQDWHEGVIGIVASRLVEDIHRPVAVCAVKENGEVTCSARSIPGISLADLLTGLSDHLQAFGGHAMAAGFRLWEKDLPAFQAAFLQACEDAGEGMDLRPRYAADAVLRTEDVRWDLYQALDALAPFGEGNPEPLFILQNTKPLSVQRLGQEGNHIRLQLAREGEEALKAMAFRYPEGKALPQGQTDILGRVVRNVFRGQESIEVQVQDLRPSWQSPHPSLYAAFDPQRKAPSYRLGTSPDRTQAPSQVFLFEDTAAAKRAYWEDTEAGKALVTPLGGHKDRETLEKAIREGQLSRLYASRTLADSLRKAGRDMVDAKDSAAAPAPDLSRLTWRQGSPSRDLLDRTLASSGWTLLYVDDDSDRHELLTTFREERFLDQRDQVLSLSPWPQERQVAKIQKAMEGESGGLFIASHATPLPSWALAFSQAILWDLPRSLDGLGHLQGLLGPQGQTVFYHNPDRIQAQKDRLQAKTPTRPLLGRLYQSLAHLQKASPQGIPWTNDLSDRLSQLARFPVTADLLAKAVGIFAEIQLLNLAHKDDVRYIRLIEPEEKKDLDQSPIFAEGLIARKALEDFFQALSLTNL